MDGERITLRLEREDLELIDRFIKESEEIDNRSQLARVAIRSYIEGVSSRPSQGAENRITIVVPRPAMGPIQRFVRDGVYKSMTEAIEGCVRDHFITKEYLETLKKRALEEELDTVSLVSD